MEKDQIKVKHIHFLENCRPTLAFCDLLLFNSFIVKGLRIVDSGERLFVSMPQEVGKDGKWYDVFFPIFKDVRMLLQDVILQAYNEQKENK